MVSFHSYVSLPDTRGQWKSDPHRLWTILSWKPVAFVLGWHGHGASPQEGCSIAGPVGPILWAQLGSPVWTVLLSGCLNMWDLYIKNYGDLMEISWDKDGYSWNMFECMRSSYMCSSQIGGLAPNSWRTFLLFAAYYPRSNQTRQLREKHILCKWMFHWSNHQQIPGFVHLARCVSTRGKVLCGY